MVGVDGRLPFPWLEAPLREAMSLSAAHAVLLHGPEGVGQFPLALVLAQVHLCEIPGPSTSNGVPCGGCPSCRLFLSQTHPDVMVIVPDAMRDPLGWLRDDGAAEESVLGGGSKAKPSKEIRVDDVRAIIAFAQSTSSRGRGKVVVMHPVERMNAIAANALLKTLEEPAGATRFVLSSTAAENLPPTVRSRCQAIALRLPSADQALAWLEVQGVKDSAKLLAACGGRPAEVIELAGLGISGSTWSALPRRVEQGGTEPFIDWPLARVVETLQKLCHDTLCLAHGAATRYFPAESLVRCADVAALTAWAAQLRRDARQCEHPWNASLKIDSLIQQAQRVLRTAKCVPESVTPDPRAFVHSAL